MFPVHQMSTRRVIDMMILERPEPHRLRSAFELAGLGQALHIGGATEPLADDPDPEQRRLAAIPIEQMMLERFGDVVAPKTNLEKRQLLARAYFLRARIAGQSAEQARSAVARIAPEAPAAPPVSEAQIALLGRLLRNPSDAADLFCRN